MTEFKLPGGWQWTTSPFDLRRGVAVAKVWWFKGAPFIRCQVGTELDRTGNRRTFGWLSYAEAVRDYHRGRPKYSRSSWQWTFIMDLPDLPPDPLAAAMTIELDFDELSRAVTEGVEGVRTVTGRTSKGVWEVEP